MKKLIILLLIFLPANIFCQWVWQNPLPQGNEVSEIQFLNSSTGYASTLGSSVIKTTDGGLTWQSFNSNDPLRLYCCFFLNENTGYIGGDKLKFKKTTDGCRTWTDIETGIGNQFLHVDKIKFFNSNTGYISAMGLYKTTNAGINWIYKYIYSYDFYFSDEFNGYVIGGDYNSTYIKKTTDGGNNWQTQYTGGVAYYGCKLKFFNIDTGYVWFSSILLKTTNGGVDWVQLPVQPYFSAMDFLNSSTGFVVRNSNLIAKTTNGGNSWDTSRLNTNYNISNIKFTGSGTSAVATGPHGILFRTTNLGLNWFNLSSGFTENISGIQFFNSQTGYVMGWNKLFAKTTNSGQNWIKMNIEGVIQNISGFYFLNSVTGYAVGGPYFIKTTNSGLNWAYNSVPVYNNLLTNIKFYGPNTGISTAIGGKVFRTTDAGYYWNQVVDMYDPAFTDISFADANTVFVCGSNYGSPILKSTNSGLNWASYNTNVNTLNGILFVDSQTGYSVGSNGTILKTTNCGTDWFTQVSGTTNELFKIFFTDSNTGYITGRDGVILKTTNSGSNWIQLKTFTNTILNGLYFTNSSTGYITGDGGSILKTTTGGQLIGVHEIKTRIPGFFYLSQNYPNPFNPNTRIKFQITKSGVVELLVFDVLGREITTLVNEQLQPGTYEAEWEASSYPSGVYFYKLITPDYTETRKMVLVK